MNHQELIIFFLYFASLLSFITPDNNLPRLPSIENLAVSCGGSGDITAKNGRLWVGDVSNKSKFFKLSGKSTISRTNNDPLMDSAVYSTARISFSEFEYEFDVKPGQFFVRLHFNPTPYKNFKRSTDSFTVKAGNYILLSNFSASLTAKALGVKYFSKEFCINVEENRRLNVKFSPVNENYAFVDGIEIVSMPTGLYFTKDGELGPVVVGQKYRFYIDNGTALETVQRLNIGGSFIDSNEDHQTMFRKWDEDFKFLSETKGVLLKKIIPITYPNSPTHTAPSKVYQTARSMAPENDSNRYNLTWRIPVDSGFRYLVRLHFCELEFKITQIGERMFTIVINDQVAEANADVLQWGGKQGASVYKDYIALMEGGRMEENHYLSITLQPNESLYGKRADGILNGLEVFKLSNPDNSLVSPNQVSVIQLDTVQKRSYFDRKNAVVTTITFMIILVNIVVYNIRYIIEPKTGERNMKSSASGSLSRSFSIDEIRSFTDNFNPKFLIGSGGYGRVYKGSIDNGATIVAIKRLKLESSQGDNEFWMEIKMLSKLRHEHLVPLIGYCNEGPERVLVYEYMPRGTVADHLYKLGRTGSYNNPPLSWEQRLKISVGAARGLYVLHTSRQTVVHRDVKSSNILLDENWVAKISDFGLSKMGPTNESITHFSTSVKGTFGYLDPECFLTKKLTRKSDVYAFGVVLFEILSGRPAVDIRLEEEQHSLAAWARYCLRIKKVDQLIEKNLITEISPPCLKVFVGIAGRCIHNHPHERPSMSDVMMSLEYALMLQQSPITEEQEEEYVMKTGRSSSDHSDGGVVSFDDLASPPPRPSNEETEPSVSASSTTAPRITKSSNNGTSSRWWWWNRFGSSPKSPSKPRTSPLQIQDGILYEFSVHEMSKATNNFHNGLIIGFSGPDTVYKGHISTAPKVVTIRRSNTTESRLRIDRELKSKMETSPSIKHPHVVSLLGYCKYESDMILVYDYHQVNGVLHDHLYDSNKEPLPWKQRVQIGINAAQGLCHLQSTVKQTVLHRNLNSSNIFLDENMIAKVSDFPLTKRIGVNNAPTNRGNWGFMDSDYIRDDKQMEKSYVFSYGLLLFELLLKPEVLTGWLDSDQVAFAQWIKSRIRYEQLTDLIDPNLQDEMSPEGFRLFVDTASKCLLDKGIERPLMTDIVTTLQAVLKLEENAHRKRGF